MSATIPPEPTPAYKAYKANLNDLEAFTEILSRGMEDDDAPIPRMHLFALAKQAHEEGRVDDAKALLAQGALVERGIAVANRWIVVIYVTIAETYLQDVLAYAEQLDPMRILDSGLELGYAEIAVAASVDELRAKLCRRWAGNFIRDGGPRKWIEKLTKMGATFGRDGLADELEEMWGIRHVVVHHAGIVTPDFLARHPQLSATLGERVPIRNDEFARCERALAELVDNTEAYLRGRLRAKASSL